MYIDRHYHHFMVINEKITQIHEYRNKHTLYLIDYIFKLYINKKKFSFQFHSQIKSK